MTGTSIHFHSSAAPLPVSGASLWAAMHAAISEVVSRCDKDEALTPDDIDRLCTSMSMTREQFHEAVLISVAPAFQRGDLTFPTGDAVANRLWTLSECSLAGRAREELLAFDEGEYYHRQDPPDADPFQLYARPQVETILRGDSST